MSAIPDAYECFVDSAALKAGPNNLMFCKKAGESGRFASSLGAHALAVAPRLTEIAQASHSLAGLLFAVRSLRAFGISVDDVTTRPGDCMGLYVIRSGLY
jgi:hypothetical protein